MTKYGGKMKNLGDCSFKEKAKFGGEVCRKCYELKFTDGPVEWKCPEGMETWDQN